MLKKAQFLTLLLAFIFAYDVSAQTVSVADLEHLFGTEMTGELIYLDYQSGDEVSIPVKLTITEKDKNTMNFAFQYPGEASANNNQKVKISKDGKTFNDQTVTERLELKSGGIQVTTVSQGKDDGKKAEFITTYVISPTGYSSEKLVRYENRKELLRNRFVLKVPG